MKMSIKFIVMMMLLGLAYAQAEDVSIAPPQGMAEVKEMMKVTWDQHILPPGADPEVLKALLEVGEVIIMNDNPPVVPWMSAAGVLVDAPAEVVFSVVTDFERYPDFVPMTASTKVKEISPNLEEVDFNLRIQVAFIGYTYEYGVYHYHRPPLRTDWSLSHGEFDICAGFWELIPVEDGLRTMTFYSTYAEPRSGFVKAIYKREPSLEMLTNVSTATVVVRAAKEKAEEIYSGSPNYVAPPSPGPKQAIDKVLLRDPRTLKLLTEKGKLLILEDGPPVYVTAGTLVSAPAEKAFEIVSHFEDCPSYIPGVRKVEKRGQGKAGPIYDWEVSMDLVFLEYKSEYTFDYNFDRPSQITWMMPLKTGGEVQGFWRFIPIEGGSSCLVFNGSTADIREMGWLPRYALKVEPTLEYALLGSQGTLTINSVKERIHSLCSTP
jgi:ribosome-associated toxin RatA of RatAB toxin-antitoxin module